MILTTKKKMFFEKSSLKNVRKKKNAEELDLFQVEQDYMHKQQCLQQVLK